MANFTNLEKENAEKIINLSSEVVEEVLNGKEFWKSKRFYGSALALIASFTLMPEQITVEYVSLLIGLAFNAYGSVVANGRLRLK